MLGVLSSAACSDGSGVSSDQLDQGTTLAPKSGPKIPQRKFLKLPHLKLPRFPHMKPPKPPEPKPPGHTGGEADGACPDPTLGAPGNRFIVGNTAAFIARCQQMGCPNGADASDFALDYGEFPFRGANFVVNGSFFYAVVEPGFEDGGFLDGAPGNLSDTTASAAPGDTGGGDTEADRTITSNPLASVLFPATHGTHAISFPPSQFEAIELSPFDVPPGGHCELAICPTGATSRCECAFAPFDVHGNQPDGGVSGSGGVTSAGGATSSGGTTGSGGHAHSGGTTSSGGATESSGGTTHAAGGSGGAPCNTGGAPPVDDGG